MQEQMEELQATGNKSRGKSGCFFFFWGVGGEVIEHVFWMFWMFLNGFGVLDMFFGCLGCFWMVFGCFRCCVGGFLFFLDVLDGFE